MDAQELEAGLRQLDQLARDEYHQSLNDVADRPEDSEKRLLAVGRLIGVMLKQPFASSTDLPAPSPYTGAYRGWVIKDDAVFDDEDVRSTWQYKALEVLRQEPEVVRSLGGWQPADVRVMAHDAQFERGFFAYLAVSCRKYLCGDAQLRKAIDTEMTKAAKAGIDIKKLTPETIVASGGLAIGATLIQHVPALGMMGAPVIAGLIFILYRIGIDAFCGWSSAHDLRNADAER